MQRQKLMRKQVLKQTQMPKLMPTPTQTLRKRLSLNRNLASNLADAKAADAGGRVVRTAIPNPLLAAM
jgi:hypothetical protein